MFDQNESVNLKKLNDYFNKVISTHEDLYQLKVNNDNLNQFKINTSVFETLKIRLLKFYQLFFVFLIIIYLYYFYIYFYTLPRFESLESGFTLDFNSKANWDLQQFKLEFYKFGFFHAIFVMFLWSFIRTIIYDPGSLSLEYKEVFSSLNILISLYYYFENFDVQSYCENLYQNENHKISDCETFITFQTERNKFDLAENPKKIKCEIDQILQKYNKIMDIFYEVLKVIDKMNNPNYIQNNNCYNISNIEEDNESFINPQSNFASNQFINQIQFINISNAIRELNYRVQIFFNKNPKHDYFLQKTSFQESNCNNNRFCRFCLLKKPDRTHHCRICKICVRKMDHHCNFLSCCIGYNNYKSFILCLVYFTSLLIYSLYYNVKALIYEFHNNFITIDTSKLIAFISIMTLVLIIIGYLLIYHIILISQNQTTIENIEKNNPRLIPEDLNEESKILIEPTEEEKTNKKNFEKHKYNKGCLRNFCDVFGYNPLLWFLPISFKNLEKSGYNYDILKIEKDLKEKLKKNIDCLKERTFSLDLQPDSIEKVNKNDW